MESENQETRRRRIQGKHNGKQNESTIIIVVLKFETRYINNKIYMDRFALEAYLYSADYDEDNYLLASSSDDSEDECYCTTLESSIQKLKEQGFAEVSIPIFEDHEFREHFRVNRTTFDKILEITRSDYSSNHNGGLDTISPEKATYILLWYLGNQETCKQISERFKVTLNTVQHIVKLGVLKLSLQKRDHIAWPSVDKYPQISQKFEDICKLSGIIGAIGVSHFKIPKLGEQAENIDSSMNCHSVALQGTVTINNKFIDIFVSKESYEPQDILHESSIPEKANNGLLDEYYLVGYNNYSNSPWLVQPFLNINNRKLNVNQKQFNECHYAASDVIPNTFGLLKGRFQRLQNLGNTELHFMIQCIEAACVIHNICIDCENGQSDFCIQDLGIQKGHSIGNNTVGDDVKQREMYQTFIARMRNNKR